MGRKPTTERKTATDLVDFVNRSIADFLIKNETFVPLGPDFSTMTYSEAAKNLQLHRIHKKFEVPGHADPIKRKQLTLENVIDYDIGGLKGFNPACMDLDPAVRHLLYNARERLNEIISDYRFSVSDLEFPSGETYVSASGDISIYAKLRDRHQWCVTLDCFDLFARVAYNTPMLKYAARRHFKTFQRESNKKFDDNAMYFKAKELYPKKYGFEIFKAKLRCIVTIVKAARLTTVPKTTLVDRVIECDAFCNMIVQRTIDKGIWELIDQHFNVDLKESQLLHKVLIQDLNNVTIDLKNASNSIWLVVVEWFMTGKSESRLLRDLKSARCGIIETSGYQYKLNMLSPMGNGFTFGVMTLLFMTICRELDSFSHVFGDDIIVDHDVAPVLIETLKSIGCQLNETKTFLNGSFRESCGGFTSSGQYITSFDIEYAEDIVDAVSVINKIGIMANSHPTELTEQLQELHYSLIKATPVHMLRGYRFGHNYAEESVKLDVLRLQILRRTPNRLTDCNSLHSDGSFDPVGTKILPGLTEGVFANPRFVKRSQLDDKRCSAKFKELAHPTVYSRRDACNVCLVFSKKNKTYKFKNGRPMRPIDNINRLLGWTYIWSGKVTAPHLRETAICSSWEILPLIG